MSIDHRTAETIAKYHDEHAGYGGSSFEFHARAATFIRSSAAEAQRLRAVDSAARDYVAHVDKLNAEARFRDNMNKLYVLIKEGQRLWDTLCAAVDPKGAEHG